MNKRHNLFGADPGPMLKADGHLSDAWLLLAIDGELAASDHALLKEHVRACWTCRARKEHLERTIEDIVDYEQALVAPDMPPSATGRAMFMARLNELSADMGQPPLLKLWRRSASQLSRSLFASRIVWIATVLFVVMAAPLIYVLRQSPAVSANELLQRASLSETRSITSVNQPVVVQRLSIKINGRKLTRTIYRDQSNERHASRADVNDAEVSAAERKFLESSLDWNDPLSPKAFDRWREAAVGERDMVKRLSGDRLMLNTTADSGPIAEASLTVRDDDYHPIAEDLRLRDNTEIEIAELSYDVVGLPTLNPDIFGFPAPAEPLRLPALSATLPTRASFSDAAQLATSELQVRAVLHDLGADLGEQIDVRPEKDGSVRVDGVAADDARKHQLVAALQGIPRTQLHIETVAQAAERQQASSVSGPVRVTVMAGGTPLLEASLKQRFPDVDQRTTYINQTLSLAQGASARAWALNRLAERYTPQQIALLDTASRRRLGSLLGDHLAALREDVNRLQNQLGQVLSPISNTAAANTASSNSSIESLELGDDWRIHVHRVHSSVETVNESVAVLLTGSSTDEKDDPEDIEIGLRTTLTQLQAELQALDQQVHKTF